MIADFYHFDSSGKVPVTVNVKYIAAVCQSNITNSWCVLVKNEVFIVDRDTALQLIDKMRQADNEKV